MRNAPIWIFIFACLFGISLAVGVPVYSQFAEPLTQEKTLAPQEFQKSFIDPKTKNIIKEKEYTTEELILLELKSINEKLGNIQLNTFRK